MKIDENTSDGYHTFKELYAHRSALFITLCRVLDSYDSHEKIWKSKIHSDGGSYDGWFILGIGKEKGNQITYHLPLREWDDIKCEVLDNAPEFDGHTPKDVLHRLRFI